MLKNIFKIALGLLSASLLLYMLLPRPDGISDFPALPDSLKSTLEGDTIQAPEVSAYFSNNYRDFVISYYQESYKADTKFPFEPLRLNYPPEFAFTAIKDQTQSTYLEEMVYPLRDSLFINGLEPVEKDGTPRYLGAGRIEVDGQFRDTKVTLRFYPSSLGSRIAVWGGINLAVALLYLMSKRVFSKQ
ncbi:hypothetical protein A2V61_02785 [Candidatus Woesebacteria bacterium RBG_19FT_COMBO_47_8]|nr:MAG: hypothetical protein A2V61_02785 [Candidatus Woesebacteria bacterium RBG_19FT_COMBO_47_8]